MCAEDRRTSKEKDLAGKVDDDGLDNVSQCTEVLLEETEEVLKVLTEVEEKVKFQSLTKDQR